MIDWGRVAELSEEVGPDEFGEVVEIFLEEVEEVIARLRAGDVSALEADMHFLKGSALNLGFSEFADLCAIAERAAAAGADTPVSPARVVASYDASKLEFTDGLAARPLVA